MNHNNHNSHHYNPIDDNDNPLVEAMDKYLIKRVNWKKKMEEENAMKKLKNDNGWKLDVKLREDLENVLIYDVSPLEPDKLYVIKNLATASDGTILVDVYAPESMGLIRSKMNINVFHILPINKKYVWRVMKFDSSTYPKINTNVMIIEAYYCAVNQNTVTILDIMEGSLDRTEIVTSDSSIFIDSGNGDVYVVLESDKDKQDQIMKKIKSKMISDVESMAMTSSSATNGPIPPYRMPVNVPIPGMSGYYGMPVPSGMPPIPGMSMGHCEMPIPQWSDPSTPKNKNEDISIEDDLGFLDKDE